VRMFEEAVPTLGVMDDHTVVTIFRESSRR
jgi:hypothetical protein